MSLPGHIGRYKVERRLGSGGFATVWLAHDEDLDTLVAIKVLSDSWSGDEDIKRRFIQEARILRRLDHERIVRVYTIDVLPSGQPYFVMEYADRGTLDDRMQERWRTGQKFSVEEAVAISREVAECLIVAHDLDIIHRDLKPRNILFRSLPIHRQNPYGPVAERMLLADFGIARQLTAATGNTISAGSPYYMAPEQADPARAGQSDQRSDIYSAAAMLYELLAGQVPFPFESATQVMRGGQSQFPLSLRTLRPDVPPGLEQVLHLGLAADPNHRFASARAWSAALRRAIAPADGGGGATRVRASGFPTDDPSTPHPASTRAPADASAPTPPPTPAQAPEAGRANNSAATTRTNLTPAAHTPASRSTTPPPGGSAPGGGAAEAGVGGGQVYPGAGQAYFPPARTMWWQRWQVWAGAMSALMLSCIALVAVLLMRDDPKRPMPPMNPNNTPGVSTNSVTQTIPTPVVNGSEEQAGAVAEQYSAGSQPAFGPEAGELTHSTADALIPTLWAGVAVQDFAVRAAFTNPYDDAPWSYGFGFRNTPAGQYRLYVTSDGGLHFELYTGSATAASSPVLTLNNLDLAGGASNELELIVEGPVAYLFVNDEYIGDSLNVGQKLEGGDVGVATGFRSDEVDGESTSYDNFEVRIKSQGSIRRAPWQRAPM